MDMQELLEEAADWIANDRDEIILCHTIDGDMATLDPEAQQKQEPYCIVYEFDTWAGLHRSTSAKPYNGARPDRAVKVYTATQPAAPADRKPAARVNEDGFLVECGDFPLAPGSVLYLGQPAAPAVPAGYKLVPVELTQKMRDAWDSSPCGDDDDENMRGAYRAMLAAAPEVKP